MNSVTGRPHNWEWTLPDGRTFDINNFPFAAADGSPLILEMDIDITQRKNVEEELRRHDAILEAVGFAAAQFLLKRETQLL